MCLESPIQAKLWSFLIHFSYCVLQISQKIDSGPFSTLKLNFHSIFVPTIPSNSRPLDIPSPLVRRARSENKNPISIWTLLCVCFGSHIHLSKTAAAKKCENRVCGGTVSLSVDGGDSSNMANKHKIVFFSFSTPNRVIFLLCVFPPPPPQNRVSTFGQFSGFSLLLSDFLLPFRSIQLQGKFRKATVSKLINSGNFFCAFFAFLWWFALNGREKMDKGAIWRWTSGAGSTIVGPKTWKSKKIGT